MTPTRPIVRYHGGKWRLAPWIISYFPAHRIYVEPYGGGGSVLLRKPRSYAEVYNDLDGEICNLFQIARDRGDELRRAVELTPYAHDEFDLSYQPAEDPLEQARRTMVRASMAIGSTGASAHNRSGFRRDVKRRGTHPATDWSRFGNSLAAVIQRLQGVVIENRPALDIIKAHDSPVTLHYIDPPYVSSTRNYHDGKGGYRHEMTDDDHRELAEVLSGLEGAVVVSGYASELYEEIYSGWIRAEREGTAWSASGARPKTEVLWMRGIDLGLFAEEEPCSTPT